MIYILRSLAVVALSLSLALAPASCRKQEPGKKETTKKPPKKAASVVIKPTDNTRRKPSAQPSDETSIAIEAITGAHTRLVWSEAQSRGRSDTFSHGMDQTLNGIDTRDGLGERTIIGTHGNYSRPLLTSDGETILYSVRGTVRKNGKKDFVASIYRTDWNGSPPVELAQGYVVDSWRDPATSVEWVYCVRKFVSVHGPSLVAKQLWRFRLDSPKTAEVLYEDSRITPDNIQLSRDGRMACGQFPWPQGGILHLDGRAPAVQKLLNGCWTSLAPDQSGVCWIFDGNHTGATLFAGGGARSWHLPFDPPSARHGESYHPRWSNHPRFTVLTGPYVAKGAGDMAVHSDDDHPDVFLGRLDEGAERFEAWVKVTKTGLSKAYPDAWIAGGEKADLKLAPAKPDAKTTLPEEGHWPAKTEGLLFLWQDRKALNSWKDNQGHSNTADLMAEGAARFGRHGELIFDGGTFAVGGEDAEPSIRHLKTQADLGFEALILSSSFGSRGWIVRAPGFGIYQEAGCLMIVGGDGKVQQAQLPDPSKDFHLVVNRNGGQIECHVNGTRLKTQPGALLPSDPGEKIVFGDRLLKQGMQCLAIYNRVLSPDEVAQTAAWHARRIATLPVPPLRVHIEGRLVETSKVPTLESIEPYTSALICSVYEVEKVVSGEFKDRRVLVKHWGLLNKHPMASLPHEIGKSYSLIIELESDHTELQGERVNDDTNAFDLTPWFDVSTPIIKP